MKARMMMSVVAAAGVFAVAAGAAMAQSVSRMYDLRDLAAVLPGEEQPPATKVPILSDLPLLGAMFRSEAPAVDPVVEDPTRNSPTDRLVQKLTSLLSMASEELVENVYFVDGEEAAQARFAEAIQRVQQMYEDRVVIEVTCAAYDASTGVVVGQRAPAPSEGAVVSKVVAPRRGTARVQATRAVSYVARWTPIVGDSSVGLEPGVASVTDGVVLDVRVSGDEGSPRVSVRGVISKADIELTSSPSEQAMRGREANASAAGAVLTIGLPRVERRVVESDVQAPRGETTVVAVVPGFEEGKQVVVSVAVRPLK
jgi:hypothetical protein